MHGCEASTKTWVASWGLHPALNVTSSVLGSVTQLNIEITKIEKYQLNEEVLLYACA